MKNKSSYGEILRQENELTKLKIQAEFGLELKESENLNPAIENIWLNQILEYERAIVNNKEILISEFLGNPLFKPVDEISDEELPELLLNVMELLRQKNIVVESVDGIDDREMYRFITEELFKTETNSCTPKNMITCFIYEEFHPNDESDIRRQTKDFINCFSDKENIHYESFIYSNKEEENEVAFEKLKLRLKYFRDAFDQINLDKFEIDAVNIYDKKAEVNFEYWLAVLPAEGKTFQYVTGHGRFDFVNVFDYWVIEEIVMPGVV